jgi:hypothetical protein
VVDQHHGGNEWETGDRSTMQAVQAVLATQTQLPQFSV